MPENEKLYFGQYSLLNYIVRNTSILTELNVSRALYWFGGRSVKIYSRPDTFLLGQMKEKLPLKGPYAITVGKAINLKGDAKNRIRVRKLSSWLSKKISHLEKESTARVAMR